MKTVRFWYDQSCTSVYEWGWYAIVEEDGRTVTDSMKVDFPVCLNLYDLDDRDELRCALESEYPDHRVCQDDYKGY